MAQSKHSVLTILVLCSTFFDIFSTNVGGPVFVNTVWKSANNPYHVTSDFQVPSGVILTIQKGTQIMFDSDDYQILIKGTLRIVGMSNEPVVFLGDTDGRRSMIMFKSTNLTQSSISHAKFNGLKPAIQLSEESEFTQDVIKNNGNLLMEFVTMNNTKLTTSGYTVRNLCFSVL
ncbi:unnamed protein product [Didymodactylos carnosus]|uniref:Uncharacterized protein n=1 Tax=Didymodactylos carnosus TaxID=1234261 RepID=A0A816AVJ1_9BILA|nr:unnamed protein product [Didymodactylos carnosus]CAF1600602.1 unnamed protein product [Didymodactylos carnosus]CAF4320604.1 unnamed protein product [Didymodactylos carnosus]CAF4477487.1 unnamed protein product [Didymodactylos carnosus]